MGTFVMRVSPVKGYPQFIRLEKCVVVVFRGYQREHLGKVVLLTRQQAKDIWAFSVAYSIKQSLSGLLAKDSSSISAFAVLTFVKIIDNYFSNS
jgi:hypothetical protein